MPRRKQEVHRTVRIYPIEGVFISGVPAVERDVTEAEAVRLNEYQPPAFVIDPLWRGEDQAPQEGEE